MSKRLFGIVAATLLMVAPLASAGPISIDFEEFAYGTQIGDYYNGGRDSLNRVGANYGLSFNGGSVKYTPTGAYLSGYVQMTLDPAKIRALLGTDSYYISFNAGVYAVDYGVVYATFESGYSEPNQYVNGNGNPYCPSRPDACDSPFHGLMGGYYVAAMTNTDVPVKLNFNTNRLDNIQIHGLSAGAQLVRPGTINASFDTGRDIPEPASLSLIGVGAAALVLRRRRNKANVVNQSEQA